MNEINPSMNDNSLEVILRHLRQEDMSLLVNMKNENCITPLFSIDKSKMVTMVKSLTPYKIDFVIKKFVMVEILMECNDGITKYYLGDNGIRLVELFGNQVNKMKNPNRPATKKGNKK